MNRDTTPPVGVNGSLFASGMFGMAAWYFWPDAADSWQHHAFSWTLAGTALASGLGGIRALTDEIRVRRRLIESEVPGDDHGSAREATREEIIARGCTDPSGGVFLGFFEDLPIFVPADVPFTLVEQPPGTGKDINHVTGEILHKALSGCSVFAIDIKPETAPMLTQGLKDAGVETWCINPVRKHQDVCGNVEVGLYEALIKAAHSNGERRKNAVGIAAKLAKLHLPDKQTDQSKLYFVGGSRRAIRIIALLKALVDPANCTPGAVCRLLNDVDAFVATLKAVVSELEPFVADDRIVAALKSEAKNLLNRYETNPENFGSFIEWATQALAPYNEAGYLADYGTASTHDIYELTERPITAFVMAPLSHADEFESFISILNDNLLTACKQNPREQKVHLVANEALKYRFDDIAGDLETLRGLGVTATFYIQSFNGLVRQYGKETAASVADYCDCKVYGGINSYDRAKFLSDMLSQATVASKDYSYRSAKDDVNISAKRHSRPLMSPDEIMSMPRDQVWVFLKCLRPFRVNTKHYGHIDPWKLMVGKNPMEGPPLLGPTLLEIDYPERKKL